MKKIFRKLACCSFLSIASIGCFDVEARLPKYQGELAVKILVEKALTNFESFVNGDYTKKQFINDIIYMVYTNECRQSLANWMHARRPDRGNYGRRLKVLDGVDKDTPLYRLLSNLLLPYTNTVEFNQDFSMLMNLAFPCWTGTLTCYMHNNGQSLAKESLQLGTVCGIDYIVAACKWLLFGNKLPKPLPKALDHDKIKTAQTIRADNVNLVKLIGVLFTLEVIDDWNQLKAIVGNTDLNAPTVPAGYQSDLIVPVPNTGYYNGSSHKYESDCHLSTLKNLLAVLCNHNYDAIVHETTSQYFVSTRVAKSIIAEVIIGETSKQNHTAWFNSLTESIKSSAEPSIYWLIYALKVPLTGYDSDFSTFKLELLKGLSNEIDAMQNAIREIKGNTNAVVEINQLQNTEVKPWRYHRLKITLPERAVIIQIDGTLTEGSHIEITDLRNTQ